MSDAMVVDYAWFIEEYMNGDYFLGMTFVRGVSPAEALHRIGATPGDVSRDWAIEAYAADGGAVLLDLHCYEMPEALSRGTETARLVTGTTMDEEFVYSINGVVATRFEPSFPDDREGSDPDYLLTHMRDLGMPLDGEEFTDTRTARDLALVLAVRATGVNLTPAHHAVPSITGSTDCPS
ncbi:DUF6461 domain-containing protein [Streptosporangium sp. 'caverna']|uniref:DUF6461 domain-containing protein n=1 Tax=Streptosporangium sp. 'caverna' TaxID=2202249 RepID=UPI0013A70936|nr:DUF6461 domain-containing protein [Streptosporangium sp. 'caverna']